MEEYLRAGKADDLSNKKERIIFRFFEILPGALSWLTIIGGILLAKFAPFWCAIFIIAFSLYWLIKAFYFSFYLKTSYKKLREFQKINWQEKLNKLSKKDFSLPIDSVDQIYHLIVFPMYKEPVEIVRETFKSLLKCNYRKDRMIVVLAVEERAGEHGKKVAEAIQKEFGDKFFHFLITFHPKDLPGEIPSKGSNEAWASKKAKELIDQLKIPYEHIIYSSFDVDTYIYPDYFACLTYHYLTTKKPLRTSFQPVPFFFNNIYQVPAISRVFSLSTSFWHIINQEREDKLITFSSHSMPFKALVDVGFKLPNVVSDDSRIFWQCFLFYNGDYRVKPLYYPVSMDANQGKRLLDTLIQIYKQQRRWAYGVGEIPYAFLGFLKNKKIPLRKKFSFGGELLEGHWNWACGSLILLLFGWLPLILGGYQFTQTLFAYNLPRIVGRILTVAMIGLFSSIYYSFYLLPKKPNKKKPNVIKVALEWFLLPVSMVFFTSLPALDAQTRWMFKRYMAFWPTPKIRNKNDYSK